MWGDFLVYLTLTSNTCDCIWPWWPSLGLILILLSLWASIPAWLHLIPMEGTNDWTPPKTCPAPILGGSRAGNAGLRTPHSSLSLTAPWQTQKYNFSKCQNIKMRPISSLVLGRFFMMKWMKWPLSYYFQQTSSWESVIGRLQAIPESIPFNITCRWISSLSQMSFIKYYLHLIETLK